MNVVDLHAKPGDKISSWQIMTCRLSRYPLLDYAAENWGFHACGVPEENCPSEILNFLQSVKELENAHLVHPQVFHPSRRRHVRPSNLIFADLFPLRVAISFGLEQVACLWVETWCAFGPPMLPASHSEMMDDELLIALLEAIENGLVSVAEALLDAGIDLLKVEELPLTVRDLTFFYVDERPKTALDKSVSYGHNAVADMLVRRGFSSDLTETTMEYAVLTENIDILGAYLSSFMGGEEEEGTDRANAILQFAIKKGRLAAVIFSLANGAELESIDEQGLTALGAAVVHGKSHLVVFLLEFGANTSAEAYEETENGAAGPKSIIEVAVTSQRVFSNRLALVNEYTLQHSSPITLQEDTEDFQKQLTTWFTNTKPLDLLTNTDFLAAVGEDSDHGMIITRLLDHGVDWSVRGADGESLLHMSVISKTRVESFLQYLKNQPNVQIEVDTRDQNGRTPLHWAAAVCSPDVMQLLIQFGASVSATDKLDATTLHFAIRSASCAKIAMEHGCRAGTRAGKLGTPLELAKFRHDPLHPLPDVIEMLQRAVDELAELENATPTAGQASSNLPNEDSEAFESFLLSRTLQCDVLSIANVEMHLRGSQQQAYAQIFARMEANAETRTRTWQLVDDSEGED